MRKEHMYKIRQCKYTDIFCVDSFLATVLFNEEPLVSVNGPVVIPPVQESISANIIPQGYSILAQDEFGHVIGVSINDEPPQDYPSIYTNTQEDRKFQKLFEYMEEKSYVNIRAPNALEVRLIAVDPVWRKKGVAKELIKETETVATLSGFDWLKMYCTSYYSNKLMSKLGWNLIYSLSYEEYINNIESNIIAPNKPHTHCYLYVRKIG